MSATRTITVQEVETESPPRLRLFGGGLKAKASSPPSPPNPPSRTITQYDDDDGKCCGCFKLRK